MMNDVRGEYIDYSQLPAVASPRRWTRAPLNFDNVGISLLTLFTVQTRDNWPEYVVALVPSKAGAPLGTSAGRAFMGKFKN